MSFLFCYSLPQQTVLTESSSVDGKRYFTCRALHAVFVRGDKVNVGDFPEEDLMDDDDDEI